jgi:hypothetical protein
VFSSSAGSSYCSSTAAGRQNRLAPLPFHQPFVLQDRQSPGDGHGVHAVPTGQFGGTGQPLARCDLAGHDLSPKVTGDLTLPGPTVT